MIWRPKFFILDAPAPTAATAVSPQGRSGGAYNECRTYQETGHAFAAENGHWLVRTWSARCISNRRLAESEVEP